MNFYNFKNLNLRTLRKSRTGKFETTGLAFAAQIVLEYTH